MHLNWSPAFVRRSYELRFGQLTGLDQSFRNFEKSYVDFHILVFFQNQNRLSQQRICLTMVLIRFASFSIDFFSFWSSVFLLLKIPKIWCGFLLFWSFCNSIRPHEDTQDLVCLLSRKQLVTCFKGSVWILETTGNVIYVALSNTYM